MVEKRKLEQKQTLMSEQCRLAKENMVALNAELEQRVRSEPLRNDKGTDKGDRLMMAVSHRKSKSSASLLWKSSESKRRLSSRAGLISEIERLASYNGRIDSSGCERIVSSLY
jgi:hypothetical protein